MNFTPCAHPNKTKPQEWVDSGGRVWLDVTCAGCGRVWREQQEAK